MGDPRVFEIKMECTSPYPVSEELRKWAAACLTVTAESLEADLGAAFVSRSSMSEAWFAGGASGVAKARFSMWVMAEAIDG